MMQRQHARRGLFGLFINLWIYRRQIFWQNVRFARQLFGQTILGPSWLILRPLISAGLMSLVFSTLLNVETGVPYILFYSLGMIPWTIFASTTNFTTRKLRAQRRFIRSYSQPRILAALGILARPFFESVFAMVAVVFIALYYFLVYDAGYLVFSPNLLIAVAAVILAFLIGLSLGMLQGIIACVARDIIFLFPVVLQVGMYTTPILYPITQFPEEWRMIILYGNPFATLVEAFRFGLLGEGYFDPTHFGILALLILIFFKISVTIFDEAMDFLVDNM